MCTVAIGLRAHAEAPLIVAANRDEALDRPATPPVRWDHFVAGRDITGGGSWLGVSDRGLFVGLTNLWWGDFRRARPRSRGRVVTDLLASETLSSASALLHALPIHEYGPFNVVCANRDGEGFVATASDRLHLQPLDPGVHVISNLAPGTPWAKTARARTDVQDALRWPRARLPAALAQRLSRVTAGGDPTQSVCVITNRNYGTVSSTILLAGGADQDVLRFADGRPDRTPYQDASDLIYRRT